MCVYMQAHVCSYPAQVQRSEDSLHGSVLSIYHVGSTDQISFDRRCTNRLHHHLASPV